MVEEHYAVIRTMKMYSNKPILAGSKSFVIRFTIFY